jgi:acyl-CoA dehydrogenase
MPFVQQPPELGNQYTADRALRSYLARALPADMLAEIAPGLSAMGDLSGGELYRQQLADRENEPTLTHWDATWTLPTRAGWRGMTEHQSERLHR